MNEPKDRDKREANMSELKEAFRKPGDAMDESDQATEIPVVPQKDRYWTDQIEAIARELSRLAIACNIDFFAPGNAERILKNDHSVCRQDNPEAFRKIRQHLMALFPLEEAAIARLGPDETKGILDQVRAAIAALRSPGGAG
jgi:hypothetical protein